MLSLAKQGILLVLFLLACELTFIGTLGWLLNQAEAEAARQERARQVSARAGRLMLVMYDTGDAVGRYARSLQLGTADSVSASKEEVPVIIKWLKNELKDNEEAIALLRPITPDTPHFKDVRDLIDEFEMELDALERLKASAAKASKGRYSEAIAILKDVSSKSKRSKLAKQKIASYRALMARPVKKAH